jgi:hypothetical protein
MDMMKRLAQLYEEDTSDSVSDKVTTISNDMIDKSVGYSEDDILYNNESDDGEIVTVADRSNYRRPTTGKYNAKYHIAKKILKFAFTVAEQQIFWQLIRPFLNINIPGRQKNIKYDFIFAKIFNLMTISDDRRQYLISLCKPVRCQSVKLKYEEIYNSIISQFVWLGSNC